jgi:replication factor C small subunit
MFSLEEAHDLPWVEKYRPDSVFSERFLDQELIIKNLQLYAQHPEKDMPHLLFSGPPGTGKTTAALALAHDILKDKFGPDTVMELNASDERGIDVVREKIKTFSTAQEFRDIPFKIIILDEADSITHDAQSALRRIMEIASTKVRFILMCNYADEIIDPIKSRCAIMRFKPLNPDRMKDHLATILQEENIEVSDACLEAIVFTAQGDLRRSINSLQLAVSVVEAPEQLTPAIIYDLAGFVDPKKIDAILDLLQAGGENQAAASGRDAFKDLHATFQDLRGISSKNLIIQLHKALRESSISKNDTRFARLVIALADIDHRITVKANEQVQFGTLAAMLWEVLHE